MEHLKLCESDYRFMTVLWDHAPLASRDLVALCARDLGWKKSTTYTVLKKLCEKGIFKTENSMVSVVISKSEFEGLQSEQFVEETFNGSLPAFLTAFNSRKKLSDKEIDEIQKLIDQMRG